jgi:hypothetical protein
MLTQVDLVREWRVSRQAVSKIVRWLLTRRVLAEVPGSGTPCRYQPGPLAESFERLSTQRPSHRAGRLTVSTPEGVEVHRGGVRVRVLDGPRREVPWKKSWQLSGVRFHQMHHHFDGERFFFKLSAGKRSSTLEVYPPRKFIWNSWDIEKAGALRKRQCVLAVRAFAKEFGLELEGPIEQHQPDEFALAAPGLLPAGDPRADEVWVDESKGKGRPELESKNGRIVARVMTLPDWQDATDKRLQDIEIAIHDITDRQARLAELLEREVGANGVNLQLIATEAAHRLNGEANGGGHA